MLKEDYERSKQRLGMMKTAKLWRELECSLWPCRVALMRHRWQRHDCRNSLRGCCFDWRTTTINSTRSSSSELTIHPVYYFFLFVRIELMLPAPATLNSLLVDIFGPCRPLPSKALPDRGMRFEGFPLLSSSSLSGAEESAARAFRFLFRPTVCLAGASFCFASLPFDPPPPPIPEGASLSPKAFAR